MGNASYYPRYGPVDPPADPGAVPRVDPGAVPRVDPGAATLTDPDAATLTASGLPPQAAALPGAATRGLAWSGHPPQAAALPGAATRGLAWKEVRTGTTAAAGGPIPAETREPALAPEVKQEQEPVENGRPRRGAAAVERQKRKKRKTLDVLTKKNDDGVDWKLFFKEDEVEFDNHCEEGRYNALVDRIHRDYLTKLKSGAHSSRLFAFDAQIKDQMIHGRSPTKIKYAAIVEFMHHYDMEHDLTNAGMHTHISQAHLEKLSSMRNEAIL
jgi:hypothetical protein